MIHFLYGDSLNQYPTIKRTMFQDRAAQFKNRLDWDVIVDANGCEIDQYDALNPLYLIDLDDAGNHLGSMRFLPTTGRTMINEHFSDIVDGVEIVSDRIWECSRFCISLTARRKTSARLLAAGAWLMQACNIKHYAAVFDGRMLRVYRTLGWSPTIVGWNDANKGLGVGFWELAQTDYEKLLTAASMTQEDMNYCAKKSKLGIESMNMQREIDDAQTCGTLRVA